MRLLPRSRTRRASDTLHLKSLRNFALQRMGNPSAFHTSYICLHRLHSNGRSTTARIAFQKKNDGDSLQRDVAFALVAPRRRGQRFVLLQANEREDEGKKMRRNLFQVGELRFRCSKRVQLQVFQSLLSQQQLVHASLVGESIFPTRGKTTFVFDDRSFVVEEALLVASTSEAKQQRRGCRATRFRFVQRNETGRMHRNEGESKTIQTNVQQQKQQKHQMGDGTQVHVDVRI